MFSKKLIGVIGAAALATMLVAGPASAAPGDLPIAAGTLGVDGAAPVVSAFSGITLNGAPQLSYLTITPFTVRDATAGSAGWHALVTIPDPTAPVSLDVIASTNITATAPVVTAVSGADMTGVSGVAITGVGLATGTNLVTATAVARASGMYLVSPLPFKLVVKANAFAETYASAATIAIATGP
jgi:hypothetical protein